MPNDPPVIPPPVGPVTPSSDSSPGPPPAPFDEQAARREISRFLESPAPAPEPIAPRPRRRKLPLILFFVTAASVFWAGAMQWMPHYYLGGLLEQFDLSSYTLDSPAMQIRRSMIEHWHDGLIYMGCLLAILLTHEMGHFVMTVRYGIPASWPFFLPLPISPVGTLGAVIGMDGLKADRREIFDIGLAGPLAGLAVCVPVLWIGIGQIDFTQPAHGPYALELPLILRWVLQWRSPVGYLGDGQLCHSQLNPYFMAGWVGLLVTGLNMLPVSQLDGGHVIYALFGRRSYWIARAFLVVAIAVIVYAWMLSWLLMVFLILLMGAEHPPTRDDSVRIGPLRTILGWLSLSIPILCFPPHVLYEL